MKKLLALVICFMFVEVGSISAQTETSVLFKKHTFEVGPEIFYITSLNYCSPAEFEKREREA